MSSSATPGSGRAVTAYMMESEFMFTLSPGDQASGTSAFLITPSRLPGPHGHRRLLLARRRR